jgi:fructoselysine-6-P-deglycase FrlB-like protein
MPVFTPQFKKRAMNAAKTFAAKHQNAAKAFAAQKARELANAAKKRINSGVSALVSKHLGNTPQSRALANAMKAHVTRGINMAHNQSSEKIKSVLS